jgi:hypothetical protein
MVKYHGIGLFIIGYLLSLRKQRKTSASKLNGVVTGAALKMARIGSYHGVTTRHEYTRSNSCLVEAANLRWYRC